MTNHSSQIGPGARALYKYAELDRLISPCSIAVVGASARAGSFGLRTLHNLREFDGAVYPVNPNHSEIAGLRCYASMNALPETPDCVVLAVGRDRVEQAVEDCVRAGAGGIIVYGSGFGETGRAELIELQDRIVNKVRGTGTRLLGPNCLGITNYARRARILFGRMPQPGPPRAGAIGLVTQSGSVSMSLGQAAERGIAISHAIPVGNAADVDIADIVAYLAQDDACSAIACVFEGVRDTARLTEAARMALVLDKPLVVYKMAVGEQGAAAALSHTGALAGSHAAYRAVLQAVGAVMVDNLEDVVETAAFLAKAGRPRGRGAAVVIGSGGMGVIAADKAEEFEVPLPQPEGDTLATLKAHVPEFGAARNPCDVTAQAMNDEGALRACAQAMLADPAYSTMVVVHPYADAAASARIPLWSELAARHGKVICNYWATEALEGHGAHALEAEPGIATFRSLRRCFGAISAWHHREQCRLRLSMPEDIPVVDMQARQDAAGMLARHGGCALTERQGKQLLALYGIPVAPDRLVQDAAQAMAAAEQVGYPVVLKIESPDIMHKTDAGVLRVGLRDAAEVQAAVAEILANAAAINPVPRINGVVVQPMVGKGLEVMLGCRVDPQFGPLVVVGLGGVMVELVRDTALAPAPFSERQAVRMLRGLRASAAFEGFRGFPAVDLQRLGAIVARFSVFVADHAQMLEEVDVNPLICSADGIVAVDALVITAAAHAESGSQPIKEQAHA